MTYDTPQPPRDLVIKILSFTDLDTKRSLGISPGRLHIPLDLELNLDLLLTRFWSGGMYSNPTYLYSPYSDFSLVPMYTIVRLTKKANSYWRNPSYIVRTVDNEVVVYESQLQGVVRKPPLDRISEIYWSPHSGSSA